MQRKVKRRRGLTRVSRKNQVTLPVAVLSQAHVRPGDELRIRVQGSGRILLVQDQDPLEPFIGSLPGLSRATALEAMRDEWDR
ncbi:MAG TPA: AbrB/MazE/SpoVT family DNA-binding domain-containing protein [Candidatus Acidoferrales bacterium]|nr:AbrB/MazE/SpoVT family DNA-binding domain-containing protein [Candidatus Acidoferrales bacterium]